MYFADLGIYVLKGSQDNASLGFFFAHIGDFAEEAWLEKELELQNEIIEKITSLHGSKKQTGNSRMKILLTGVTGYIAQQLLPVLLQNGHKVVCCARDKNRFNKQNYGTENLSIVETDFLEKESLQNIPNDVVD